MSSMAAAASDAYPAAMADDSGTGAALAHVSDELRARDRERWLSCLWAPPDARPSLVAIHALDAEMARIVADIREPLLAEIRLAWWREQVQALARGAPPPAQPLLKLLAAEARPRIDLERLVAIEEAFLPLVAGGPLSPAEICERRGRPLFEALFAACGRDDAPGRAAARAAGQAWAAADLLRQPWDLGADPASPGRSIPPGPSAPQVRLLPAPLRALAALARHDLAQGAQGRPPAPRGTAGRQLRMARAALLPALGLR